jgi:hypothetical protein
MVKIVAIVLIVLGVLALVYGGFTYTRETAALDLGPVGIEVVERERVSIPVWAGIGAIGLGVALLLVDARRARRPS